MKNKLYFGAASILLTFSSTAALAHARAEPVARIPVLECEAPKKVMVDAALR